LLRSTHLTTTGLHTVKEIRRSHDSMCWKYRLSG